MDDFAPGPEGTVTLAGVRVPACLVGAPPAGAAADRDGLLLLDVTVENGGLVGEIAAHDPAAVDEAGRVALRGRMAWPCPVDLHTHIDKGHIWPRTPNPDGTFSSALGAVARDRGAAWSAADVAARMDFSLRCAHAHGTRALRTHIDSLAPQDRISWPVFAEARERWADRIALQGVALCVSDSIRGAAGDDLARLVAEHGGILGFVPDVTGDLDGDLDRLLSLAVAHGLDLDLHVDETGDPASRALRHLAQAAIRRRFPGRIVAGHCCSLAVQDEGEALSTLDLVAEARIAIVSLPMCNMYLQGRQAGRTPRWRGVTIAHEIRERGIPLAFASDNTRDPFYAYGDLDMLEVFREATRITQLDHPFGDWPATIATAPAAIMSLSDAGSIRAGAPADLVIFEGRGWSEVLSRPESRRVVLRAGRPIDATPPAYAELDHLFPA